MNGASTKPVISVVKIITADTRPPMRVARNGPMPMPSRWSSVAGAVMLFHSPMSRMKKTRPEAVDGEMDPNTASWRSHHGDITSTNRADAADGCGERDGRPGLALGFRIAPPARPARQARQRSQMNAIPSAPRTSSPSFRDSVAIPASSPARTKERGDPRRPRAPIHSAAATSGWNSEKLSGWTMYVNDRTGIATRNPAPIATRRRAPASRAMAQVSGAAVAPISAKGSADAQATSPKSSRNGTWTTDASGIQWAFDGIGRTGSAGTTPPTSGKIQIRSMLNPSPAASARATST